MSGEGSTSFSLLGTVILWRMVWRGRHNQTLGARGESAAQQYLRQRGYRILLTNYRCRFGEVDLIARDGETLVFVEVKTRAQSQYGSPFEAVDARKQRTIQQVAAHYVQTRQVAACAIRFDVVGVHWRDGRGHCELIQHAFEADSA